MSTYYVLGAQVKKRIFWDLETSDLNADWGTIFCAGYKVEGERVKVISITDFPGWEKEPWNDKRVVAEFVNVLNREDVGIEVTHYGSLFDIPYLQARMAYHKLGVLPILGHVDTYFAARSKLKIKSRSLANLSEFLGSPFKKTPLTPNVWRKAGRGDAEALEYISKHCHADVKVLEWVHDQIAPMMRRYPTVGLWGSCHVCGADEFQRRGYGIDAKSGRRIRLQCKQCGSWTQRAA